MDPELSISIDTTVSRKFEKKVYFCVELYEIWTKQRFAKKMQHLESASVVPTLLISFAVHTDERAHSGGV